MNGFCPSVSPEKLSAVETAASYRLGDQGNALTPAETILDDEFRLNADYIVAPICAFWFFAKACRTEADIHDLRRSI